MKGFPKDHLDLVALERQFLDALDTCEGVQSDAPDFILVEDERSDMHASELVGSDAAERSLPHFEAVEDVGQRLRYGIIGCRLVADEVVALVRISKVAIGRQLDARVVVLCAFIVVEAPQLVREDVGAVAVDDGRRQEIDQAQNRRTEGTRKVTSRRR